jgi:anti-sigma B factor antagonist
MAVSPTANERSFDVTVERVDGSCVIVFTGQLDMGAADELWRCIDAVRTSGHPVVIDLSGATFMDSSGVKVLLHTYVAQGQLLEAVVLKSPSEAVRRVLTMTDAARVFSIADG